ncbi:MAG: protoporphyrinogen oxidase [Chloroflexi bacterium]|nr:protoporphyrinogen oxidase [Chloroflexota bacterium]
MEKIAFNIAIVGGGISGLTMAYELEKAAAEKGFPLNTVLIESTPQLGGKIATHRSGDFVMEGGPESFVTRKPEAWELCHELGIEDRLVGTASSGKNYVLLNGRPAAVPMSPVSLIKTPLLSTSAKFRLLKEPFTAPRTDPSDESLGSFLRRRIGDEAVDNLAKPAIGSIYLGDVDAMSVQVSFGQFAEMERSHGSLVKGMFAMMKAKKAAREATDEPVVKKPTFATLRGGLMELVDAVASKLNGTILTETAVTAIDHTPTNSHPYQLTLSNGGGTLEVDAVVLATPTFVMADLLDVHDTAVATQLRDVIYNPVATVNVSFNRSDIADPFDGFGVVVPEHENSQLLAVEGMSVKFPHRAPDDQFVLRAFVGGRHQAELVDWSDDELVALVCAELKTIFDITTAPTMSKVFRWRPANPQPSVGHLTMIENVEAQLKTTLPNLYLIGAGLRGQGIPDCIRQARKLTTQIVNEIQNIAVKA